MLRPKEVCQRLGTSYRTLKEYVKKGYIKRVWVGVIPLKGQRDMNWAMPRDLGEAQGLRIEYKFKKFYEAQTP